MYRSREEDQTNRRRCCI